MPNEKSDEQLTKTLINGKRAENFYWRPLPLRRNVKGKKRVSTSWPPFDKKLWGSTDSPTQEYKTSVEESIEVYGVPCEHIRARHPRTSNEKHMCFSAVGWLPWEAILISTLISLMWRWWSEFADQYITNMNQVSVLKGMNTFSPHVPSGTSRASSTLRESIPEDFQRYCAAAWHFQQFSRLGQ